MFFSVDVLIVWLVAIRMARIAKTPQWCVPSRSRSANGSETATARIAIANQ